MCRLFGHQTAKRFLFLMLYDFCISFSDWPGLSATSCLGAFAVMYLFLFRHRKVIFQAEGACTAPNRRCRLSSHLNGHQVARFVPPEPQIENAIGQERQPGRKGRRFQGEYGVKGAQ